MKEENDQLRVLVCQVGSRHRYAIPRMLESAGVLSALYTDSSSSSFLGRMAESSIVHKYPRAQRLRKRIIGGVPSEKVFSCDFPLIESALFGLYRHGKSDFDKNIAYGDSLSRIMMRWGVGDSNIVYSMNCSCLDFVEFAKKRRCRSVIEVFMHPKTEQIYGDEIRIYPQYHDNLKKTPINEQERFWLRAISLADVLLCPSDWVAHGISELSKSARQKVRVVPYGSSIDFAGRTNSPIEGRVFFAGSNVIGKGLHYLAESVKKLRVNTDFKIDLRVAGAFSAVITKSPLFEGINFLGKLTSEEMKHEYLTADLFVLPSLTEGFGAVIAEAICAGCPVIVTKECGISITNGEEGIVVPSRDPIALADAIMCIVGDRSRRERMSQNCLSRAKYFSECAWRNRLITGIAK